MFFPVILFCFLFVDFGLISSRKIVLNQESRDRSTSTSPAAARQNDNSLKSNADKNVMNKLHRMYRTEVENKDTDLHHLLILKQQYIARNQIEEVEIDLALDFVPDWSKMDRWSSTARQGIEIRRQKWQYILEKHSDIPLVQNLTGELAKSGLNQSTFCRELAEAYFILSHNSYVYSKGPAANEKTSKSSQIVLHPGMDKSLKIFMHSLPDSDFKFDDTEDLIKIPRSVYHKLLRKDAQMALLKKHHELDAASEKHHSRHRNTHRHQDESETEKPETTLAQNITRAANTTVTSPTTQVVDSVLNSSSDSSSTDTDSSSNDDDDNEDNDDDDDENNNNDSDDDSTDTETDSSWEWTDSE